MNHLLLIRHGYRADWENPDGDWPRMDTPLAAVGHEQAQRSATCISQMTPTRTPVWTSPFTRCLQTADPIAHALRVKPVVHWNLGEVLPSDALPDGWDGKRELEKSAWKRASKAVGKPPWPEDGLDLDRRIQSLAITASRFISPTGWVVLVSHGGVLNGLLQCLTDRQLWTDWQPCAITVLQRKPSGRHWQVAGPFTDYHHLGETYRTPPRLIQG